MAVDEYTRAISDLPTEIILPKKNARWLCHCFGQADPHPRHRIDPYSKGWWVPSSWKDGSLKLELRECGMDFLHSMSCQGKILAHFSIRMHAELTAAPRQVDGLAFSSRHARWYH